MNKEKLIFYYKKMYAMRQFDDYCFRLKKQDIIMNGFHPYSGQEAVATGICDSLNNNDTVVSTHRPTGHALAKNVSMRKLFCELTGRRGGVCEGIGGPMQFIDLDKQFYCGSIVGSGITIAAGMGLVMKQEKKGRVCVCFFGDGATNTGSFHEGLNLAAIKKLPVIYVCENNQYGEAMPAKEFVSAYPISKRGSAYGLEGIRVDGNDLEEVLEVASQCISKARNGEGPFFIEAVTYRFRGHYGGDPEFTYRTREEVEEWKKKCPILRIKNKLISEGLAISEIKKMEKEVIAEVERDEKYALAQPFPTLAQATDHVMSTF